MTDILKRQLEDANSKAENAHNSLQLNVRELKKTLDDSQKELLNKILVLQEDRGFETARSMVVELEIEHETGTPGRMRKLFNEK